jgi:MOSC domain-containing protein YiiM
MTEVTAGIADERRDGQQQAGAFGTVTSVNISAKKGTRKTPLEGGSARILIGSGVEGDAHAGDWHRQVSFLAEESIEKARAMGLDVKEGDFAENITTEGINLPAIPVGTRLRVGDTEVEISQIGKVCHTRCAIYHLAGDCIFPREGIFSVVRKEGTVKVGDAIEVLAWGDGSCDATPQEALDEVEAARAAGTL